MKRKVIITIILFLFSYYYIDKATNFIKENDQLMQKIKEKDFVIEPIDAIITNHTMIPGVSGQKVNLNKSYNKMKKINKFSESLLVLEKINPQLSINNQYDKIILRGNDQNKRLSIILEINNDNLFQKLNALLNANNINMDVLTTQNYYLSNSHLESMVNTTYQKQTDYCLTYNLVINNDCVKNHKYTILGYRIHHDYLSETKKVLRNGLFIVYAFQENNYTNLNTIIKYLKNNNYTIVTINELIKE